MIKHTLPQHLKFSWAITVLMLLASLVSLAGCGSGNRGDEGLDRVPNVPPSTRAAGGGSVAEPKGR